MDKIWSFFSSIKLAIVLFVLISVTSVFGTVVIQNAPYEKGVKSLAKLTGYSLAEKIYPIAERLGLTDMYDSWWFISLLFLFSVNIIVCSIDRFPRVWKLIKEPVRPVSDEYLNTLGTRTEISVKKDSDSLSKRLSEGLKKIGFRSIYVYGTDFICAEKGRFTRLGVYVVHLSIVVILFGAMINGIFGYNGYMNIIEGETEKTVQLGGGKKLDLDFGIRCEDFNVEFYGNTNRPKSYSSALSIIKDGSVIKKKNIQVNDPLILGDIKIYQTGYGFFFRKDADFILKVLNREGQEQTLRLKYGERFKIHGTDIEGKISDFNPSFALDAQGNMIIREKSMSNPAVFIEFYERGTYKESRWLFKRDPDSWRVMGGNTIEFVDLWGTQYTGLQVNKMPGLSLIYLGFIILSIGLYVVFFMSHQRIWIRIEGEKSRVRLIISGSTNKGGDAVRKKIEVLSRLLK